MNRRDFLNFAKKTLLISCAFQFSKSQIVLGGVIGHLNFWKKKRNSNPVVITVTKNVKNFNVREAAMSAPHFWDGVTATTFDVIINPGIYLVSDSLTKPAFNSGLLPAGSTLTVINNGYILGRGGNGNSFFGGAAVVASAGGAGVSLTLPASIDNTSGYICGGGGGGGGNPVLTVTEPTTNMGGHGGGGAGGGLGGANGSIGETGTGGGAGLTGNNGTGINGGGGGCIFPGFGGSGGVSAFTTVSRTAILNGRGGAAGGGGSINLVTTVLGKIFTYTYYTGGGGGGWGAVGGNGQNIAGTTGDSDVWGGAGGAGTATGRNGNAASGTIAAGLNPSSIGAAGGSAVELNGHAVTWVGGAASTSRIYGAVV